MKQIEFFMASAPLEFKKRINMWIDARKNDIIVNDIIIFINDKRPDRQFDAFVIYEIKPNN
jgi:hypothetical protein